tara:strand:- start:2198 stop:2863 length:666 start_codon:yes stop_codon:yes gene_type:complete
VLHICDSDDKVSLPSGFENHYLLFRSADLDTCIELIESRSICLVFVELNLFGGSTSYFIKKLRDRFGYVNLSIVVLSEEEASFVEALFLKHGADAFWIRPISIGSFSARVDTILRRVDASREQFRSRNNNCSHITMNRAKFNIQFDEQSISLSKKEFELLEILVEYPKKVFSRTEIQKELWVETKLKNQRTIDVHIKNLRGKLGDKIITTVKGVGYKLDCC